MRILIVEDEPKISAAIKHALEAEFFAVDIAADGEQGAWLGRTNEYDCIMLDNLLPKKTGQEVCVELRAHAITTPILMLSVKSETTTKVDMLNAGADDYMTKPFSNDELIARIRALLRRPKKSTEELLTVGAITLNNKRHVITKDEVEIYLTKKEFMLLEYLMQNKGEVLSRGMIMEHVWDMNADPFSNTIESHIRSLRKKLDNGSHEWIQTIPGRGYKLG